MNNKYITNRTNLINKLPNEESILISGNGLLSRSADVNYPFRQDSNMIYLSGVEEPFSSLLIDIKHNKSYLVFTNLTSKQKTFDGEIDYKSHLNTSGCDDYLTYRQLALMLKNSKVSLNLPAKVSNHELYANQHRHWLKKYLTNYRVTFNDNRHEIAKLRMIKQDYEISNIRMAVAITKNAFKQIEKDIWQKSYTEKSLAWRVSEEFAKQGAGHAYEPIVANGTNAAVLHHKPSAKKVIKNSPTLLDIGAEYKNYAADISRTITTTNDKIYNDLILVQNEIISAVKPGMTFKELQILAKDNIAAIAKANGLKEPIDNLFPHAVGHHLGLDVHDAADYSVPLHENMVITIEPGLYSKKDGFGYRVEDDVLITESGAKVL